MIHTIMLLVLRMPSLPSDWTSGDIKGVLAWGGKFDMKWEQSDLVSASIKSLNGNKTKIVYNGSSYEINLKRGESQELRFNGQKYEN